MPAALAFYGLGLVALSIAHAVLPQRDGVLAITQVFAPHLFLPLVVAVPVAVVGRWRTAGFLIAVAAVVAAASMKAAISNGIRMAKAPTETRMPAIA